MTLLKIKHVRLRQRYGEGEIPHEAKTGAGPILLTCSFPYVRNWLNEHPFRNEPEARLICNLITGRPVNPEAMWTMMKQLRNRISLTYSPGEKRFQIPSNLYIIGTMNSADRSIAFVDYALRRRFYFKDFYPDLEMLFSWLNQNSVANVDNNFVINILRDINKIVEEKIGKEYQIGQSYFMKERLDLASLKKIINYSIMPLIEVYFLGKKDQIMVIKEICNRAISQTASENIPSS